MEKWMDKGIEFASDYGLKIIGAIAIWIIGSWVIKKITKAVGNIMSKKNYDESLQKFLLNLVGILLKVLLSDGLVIEGFSKVTAPMTFGSIVSSAGRWSISRRRHSRRPHDSETL